MTDEAVCYGLHRAIKGIRDRGRTNGVSRAGNGDEGGDGDPF